MAGLSKGESTMYYYKTPKLGFNHPLIHSKKNDTVETIINYLLLKRPPYWPPIDKPWPSIDIQLFLQQKCCDNSLLSSIWPLSGPFVTSIWALVSTNTLTLSKRMRGTSKTVRSVHTEQTYDHTVHTERTYVHSVATVQTHVCAVTMIWTYYVSWLHSLP